MNSNNAVQTSDIQARPYRSYMRMHKRNFTYGIVSVFLVNLFDVLTPLALKFGIDAIEGKNSRSLLHAIGLYLALMVGVTIFRYAWRVYFGRFHHAVAEDLRNRIFAKFTELGPSFYQRKPVGELMSLLTNDVNSFRMGIGPGTLILFDAIFYILMILPIMISISFSWTWKTLIILPFVPFFMRKMESLIHERFLTQQEKLAVVSANAQEIVSGIRVIKSFAQEENQSAKFNYVSADYESACNKMAKVDAAFQPVMQAAVASGGVILLYLCTPEVTSGAVTLGSFVAFHEYIRRMVWPMSAIGMSISMLEQGRASFARIRDLLITSTDIPDTGTRLLERFERLEVKDLTFRYPGAPTDALKNVSFIIEAGSTIGIVGPVGAGKTTLLQLLTRLYPVEPGHILVNGYDISEYRRDSLASAFSLVTQDAFLFSDTVAENIAFGFSNFPGMEPVEEAATVVNIDKEIREIPEHYSAYLGERGVNLSGGQKQRLTIARALIRRSLVLMMDDSLSAVDGRTEKTIVGALREAREKNPAQTVLLVSHRLATLNRADHIFVLNRGEIEAMGTHRELLTKSPTYQHLHELQTKKPQNGTALGELA